MGWKRGGVTGENPDYWWVDPGYFGDPRPHSMRVIHTPRFSRNIADAWPVALKCEADQTERVSSRHTDLSSSVSYEFTRALLEALHCAEFDHMGDLMLTEITPLIICHAALQAVQA